VLVDKVTRRIDNDTIETIEPQSAAIELVDQCQGRCHPLSGEHRIARRSDTFRRADLSRYRPVAQMTRHTRCSNVGWCDLRIDGIGRPFAAVGQRDGEPVPEPLISQNIREFSRETLFRRFLESHVGKPFADFTKGRLQTGMTLQGFNQ